MISRLADSDLADLAYAPAKRESVSERQDRRHEGADADEDFRAERSSEPTRVS